MTQQIDNDTIIEKHLGALKDGQEFPTESSLFHALGFEKKKRSSRQIDTLRNHIQQYLIYEKIDNSSRKVKIITIYDDKISMEDGRAHNKGGNHTKYLPYIKHILLEMLVEEKRKSILHFPRKAFILRELSFDSRGKLLDRKSDDIETVWKYKRELRNLLWSKTKTALDHLQKDGLLEWEERLVGYWDPSKAPPLGNIVEDVLNDPELLEKSKGKYGKDIFLLCREHEEFILQAQKEFCKEHEISETACFLSKSWNPRYKDFINKKAQEYGYEGIWREVIIPVLDYEQIEEKLINDSMEEDPYTKVKRFAYEYMEKVLDTKEYEVYPDQKKKDEIKVQYISGAFGSPSDLLKFAEQKANKTYGLRSKDVNMLHKKIFETIISQKKEPEEPQST